ncbi:MAG: hypothetical protein GX175_04580 [Halanaerobiaceae bacterium]|jgi:hypothetical protein|nr:hypothetical protein [Halanaerobiaceae bacterium]
MSDKGNITAIQVVVIVLFVLIVSVIGLLLNNNGSYDIEDVKAKIEKHLYEKDGEECVADRI